MKRSHSVDISATRFAEQLSSRRRALGLSKVDLAEKACVSAKVVHQIETGSRTNFLEKTLLLLAEAIDIPLEELLQPAESESSSPSQPSEDAPADGIRQPGQLSTTPRRRQGRLLAAALVVVVGTLAIALSMGPHRSPQVPRVNLIGSTVSAANPSTGELIWSRTFDSTVYLAEPSPWLDGTVLATLHADGPDGGRVLLLDGRTGDTIWSRSPDTELVEKAFGEGVLEGVLNFSPILCRRLDLDGDGVPELAVAFTHTRRFPSSVMVLNRAGEVLGEYLNRGHVHDMAVVDLEGNGREALICVGANHSTHDYGGTVFILDREHWSGAAVDLVNGGCLDLGDGSLRRILIPSFGQEVGAFWKPPRVEALRVLASRSSDRPLQVMVTVGVAELCLQLILDQDLNPAALRPTDSVARAIATWPVDDPASFGPNSPAWREQWMTGIVRVDRYARAGEETDEPAYELIGIAASDPTGASG